MHRAFRFSSMRIPALLAVVLAGVAIAFLPTQRAAASDDRAGGKATVRDFSSNAYTWPAPDLPAADLRKFTFGNRIFNTNWVTAPASVASLDGLGPIFNRVSCSGCHTRDGRGRAPDGRDDPMTSMLVRLSVPGASEHGGPVPHPVYGGQLQDKSIDGIPAEGRAALSWEAVPGSYGDGEAYELRRPVIELVDLAYGDPGEGLLLSPRVANPVFGLGLLAAIPDETLLARADPDDRDGDGISGRPNRVWDVERARTVIGRFGWKASAPNLRQQAAGAANGDIGLTSSVFPRDHTTASQTAAQEAPAGGTPELSDEALDKLVFYLRTLAVPDRRPASTPEIRRGEQLFHTARCDACHSPEVRTGTVADIPVLSEQTIRPYTDLLLHDMGEGLADGRPDFEATGSEWRTAPLWGIGLLHKVNGHTTLLHDGRARDAAEAILWHGGEATKSREAFRTMPAADRQAILNFLGSL